MRNHLFKWVGIFTLILTTIARAEDLKPVPESQQLLELYRSYEMPEAPAAKPFSAPWRYGDVPAQTQ